MPNQWGHNQEIRIYKCCDGFCIISQNGDNRADIGKKATRSERHGNSITIKDFGDQFSRNVLDGKSHNHMCTF
jgi:hypothetical protein